MTLKKATVVMLLTNDEEAKLYIETINTLENRLYLTHEEFINPETFKLQNLYIVSDEEIKEGDYYLNTSNNIITIHTALNTYGGLDNLCNNKKIIATIDKRHTGMTEGNVFYTFLPQLPQSFIEEYITEYNKGNIITDVMIEYDYITTNEDWSKRPVEISGYEKLKVNPKDNTITIKRLKDSWTRDELSNIIHKFVNDLLTEPQEENVYNFTEKWLKQNL